MTNFTKHQTEQQKIQSNVVNATDNISNKSNNSDNPVTLHLKYGVRVCVCVLPRIKRKSSGHSNGISTIHSPRNQQ